MNYLLIDLKATKTNMLQSLGLLAPAPVMPALLMAHALDHKLDQPLGIQGVGLVHQHAAPWIEYLDNQKGYLERALVQRRGACLFDKRDIASGSGAGPQQNAMQPMALADIEWTLLLQCERSISSHEQVRETLLRMRLAGGPIRSAHVSTHSTWDDAMAHTLRNGFWIEDATDLLTDAADPLSAALDAVHSRGNGWIVPANLGYALLEPPRERRGARDGREHTFAEPMIGLIRYVPATVARSPERALSPQDLWRYGWDADQFLITNRRSISLQPNLNS
jgi:CRISPR-associated protein Csy2